MPSRTLSFLSMSKYERLLPRMFPEAIGFQLLDRQGSVFWNYGVAASSDQEDDANAEWSDFCPGVSRCQMPGGEVWFRSVLMTASQGECASLVVAFDTRKSVPLSIAAEKLGGTFADAVDFLEEEIELQSECNQLAVELTERYEELNLVYATKDQVDYYEEGQDALVRLVHNCAEYLDVSLAALICRERRLTLRQVNAGEPLVDVEQVLKLLEGAIYDRVESQVVGVVLNDDDEEERARLFSGRSENLVAHPVIDDHGKTIGILAVVANPGAHTFSNGDRNLLEVMAKKASRIIHTHHDSLTGLMNRNGFESTLVTTLSNACSNNSHLQPGPE